MTDAALRVGSIEVLAALALFGVVAWRVQPPQPEPAAPAAIDVDLVVHEPPARGGDRNVRVRVPNRGSVTIGRSSDADVWLVDPEASRAHASLSATAGAIYLADAGSSNGTFLNGKPVGPGAIEVLAGDVIDVGTTRISVNEILPA